MSMKKYSPKTYKYTVKSKILFLYLFCIDIVCKFFKLFLTKKILPKEIKNIILANTAHMGDAVYLSYILPELKKKYPNSNIDILVGSWSETIFNHNPHVNNIFILDHWKHCRNDKSTIYNFYKYISNFIHQMFAIRRVPKYDLAVDLYPFYPNNILFLKLIGSKYVLSYDSSGFGILSDTSTSWIDSEKHTVEYHLDLLKKININLTVKNNEQKIFFKKNTIELKNKNLLISPCSGNTIREWPCEFFIELIDAMTNHGYHAYLFGLGERENGVCSYIERNVGKKEMLVNLCNKLDWNSYLSYISEGDILLSNESLFAHLGASLNKKVIMIKSGTTRDSHWRPYSSHSTVVRYDTHCYPCYNHNGCKQMSCIKKISPKKVGNFILQQCPHN